MAPGGGGSVSPENGSGPPMAGGGLEAGGRGPLPLGAPPPPRGPQVVLAGGGGGLRGTRCRCTEGYCCGTTGGGGISAGVGSSPGRGGGSAVPGIGGGRWPVGGRPSLVYNSIILCWLFITKDQCKKLHASCNILVSAQNRKMNKGSRVSVLKILRVIPVPD